MSISDMLDIILIVVITLYAFIHVCNLAYVNGSSDTEKNKKRMKTM